MGKHTTRATLNRGCRYFHNKEEEKVCKEMRMLPRLCQSTSPKKDLIRVLAVEIAPNRILAYTKINNIYILLRGL